MITSKTVFILGAGASFPYGYPTGPELRKTICKEFAQEYEILAGIPDREIGYFTKAFFNSSIISIDAFLARNPHYSMYGKIAILHSILKSERESNYREDSKIPEQDWYKYLFNRMVEGLKGSEGYKDFGKNNVIFITFNYDRSLEQFFYESLCNLYTYCDPKEIYKALNNIKIYHVYGKVAPLPWEDDTKRNCLEFKSEIDINVLNYFHKNIRVIDERSEESVEFEEIQKDIKEANHIYFLGFGYAKENLDLFNLDTILDRSKQIYGTAFGLYEQEYRKVVSFFKQKKILNPTIVPDDCLTLLRKYLHE